MSDDIFTNQIPGSDLYTNRRYVCDKLGCFELTRFWGGLCPEHEAQKVAAELLEKMKDGLDD